MTVVAEGRTEWRDISRIVNHAVTFDFHRGNLQVEVQLMDL